MSRKLQKFLDCFTIKNKIIVSCLPFILLSYLIIILSIVTMMFRQSKGIVYEQTEQNIIEKSSLINNTLKNYDYLTEKFLYYSSGVQGYLITSQEASSESTKKMLRDFISEKTASMLTDNMPSIMTVMLFNQFDELYINNAIYASTVSTTTDMKNRLYPKANSLHGKMLIASNPYKPGFLTLARSVYVPVLEKSDVETGFLMLDLQKSEFNKLLELTQNEDAISILLLDENNRILVNSSKLSDETCMDLLQGTLPRHYKKDQIFLDYSNCKLVTLIDENILFKDIYRTFVIEIIIIIMSVLLILAAVILTGNTISNQVKRFTDKLMQTNQIDNNAFIQIESKDEFRELSQVYNDMLSRIHHLVDTVYLKELLTKDAQLKSLQAQINPHFLYNTLDCINGLIELGNREDAKKTVTALASIMRMSIKGNSFLTIGEDLTYIQQYIFIQKIRFRDKILFLTEIPFALYGYYIPKLIIQPLIENAIIHGVSNMDETGMIGIFGQEEADKIYITIKDNGSGIPADVLHMLSAPEAISDSISAADIAHIGILNIQKRLQLIYGNSFGLSATPLSPSGSCVTVCIPKKERL